ncbi:hypothetical protein ACIA5C_48355 [Actinoplanes sp. NPDC051343]
MTADRYRRAVPFLVRLRPNAAYLALIAAGIAMIIYGIALDGVLRLVLPY